MIRRPASSASPARGVRSLAAIGLATLLGLALGAALPAGCAGRPFMESGLTGTCDGACAHYVQCKPGHAETDRNRCLAECPEVLSDRDSLMAYESLTCQNAIEYIDGNAARTAAHR